MATGNIGTGLGHCPYCIGTGASYTGMKNQLLICREKKEEEKTDHIVIAMDCFRDNIPETVMVKKMAIYNVYTEGHETFHFLPKRAWSDLHKKAQEQNEFIRKYLHNLDYYSGNIPLAQLPIILREKTANACAVYTKGLENMKYISKILNRTVFNVDDLLSKMSQDEMTKVKSPYPKLISIDSFLGTTKQLHCLDDHKREHYYGKSNNSFNYPCCLQRAQLWGHIVKEYLRRELEQQQQQQQEHLIETVDVEADATAVAAAVASNDINTSYLIRYGPKIYRL
jgi:hypothetical protein